MPDIVSRIKVEAQGADQAAREIRKLKEAYDQVAASARSLSPSGVGAADPFAKAVSPNSGVMAGGQSNADVAERETRNRRYQEQTREREQSNQNYNGAIRPGTVTQGFSTAEAMASNRGGAAIGGASNMLGGILGGGVGMALMGIGAAAFGVQQLAEKSRARLDAVFGGGISQRLGNTYATTQNYMTGLARTGVPLGMVQGLMSAASASGAQLNEGTVGQFGMMANIAVGSGVDTGTLGALLGAQQRAGIASDYGTLSRGAGTFGRGSLGTFFTELTRTIEGAMQSGISLSNEELATRGNVLAGFAQFGGLSATGAVAMNQMTENRARQAGLLQNPEDIVAFQAIRAANPNASVTDVIGMMEGDPLSTNKAVLQYLQRATGGNTDELRLRVRQYLGGSATMGQVDAFINTMGAEGIGSGEGIQTAGIYGKRYIRDEQGNIVYDESGAAMTEDIDSARRTEALLNVEMLKGVQDAALELTTALGSVSSWILGRDVTTDAGAVGLNGVRTDLIEQAKEEVRQSIDNVNELTVQDVSNLHVEIDRSNLTARELDKLNPWIQDPRFATNVSSVLSLRDDPALQSLIDSMPMYGDSWDQLKASGFESIGTGSSAGVGSFSDLFGDILGGVSSEASREASELGTRDERNAQMRENSRVFGEFLNRNIATTEQLESAIMELKAALTEAGYVFTDGGLELGGE